MTFGITGFCLRECERGMKFSNIGASQKIGDGRELLLPTAAVCCLLKRRLCYNAVCSAGMAGLDLRRPCFANLWAKRSRPSRRPAAFLRLMSA